MRLETKKYLEDARNAIAAIENYTAGKVLSDYQEDRFLRAAVEREFLIIGEAIAQLAKIDADVEAGRCPQRIAIWQSLCITPLDPRVFFAVFAVLSAFARNAYRNSFSYQTTFLLSWPAIRTSRSASLSMSTRRMS